MGKQDKLKELIAAGNLSEIFISNLGWDEANTSAIELPVTFAEKTSTFNVEVVAEKRGFAVCSATCDELPSKSVRQKLERALTRIHYEHLLVLRDNDGNQIWMISYKFPGKPIRQMEVLVGTGQSPDFLLEKLDGLIFTLDEESSLGISDVTTRINKVFARNAEIVTRSFYERFRKELEKFQSFIIGLTKQVDKEQYAALMLNRLMFIYFIQKKKFLDDDRDYLKNRLKLTQKEHGRDEFYKGFYRHFLITLFHRGLGAPQKSRTAEVQKLIGKVPYLNGGLFDESALEKQYGDKLDIADSAFERIFAFFDEYRWHLDNRLTATGQDINPDVIGYIFEKYINDRAQTGSYYTQEDVTGYIAGNTVLPYLLRRAKEKCAIAFDERNGTIWKLLRENPDRYIYDALKYGCQITNNELPSHVTDGLDVAAPNLLQQRKTWNMVADNDEIALPTETWREVIIRRDRYATLKNKISNGEITDIADLTTYNLDIEKLTDDFLGQHEGADLIAAFYAAVAGRDKIEGYPGDPVRGITVLDPACGSGAFLFAALNVLEPLYEKCIHRMREFVEEDILLNERRGGMKKYPHFRAVLTDLEQHKNERYWIYRNIILRNLFGVDIMPEAVEVAKLRLFLKLAAEAKMDKEKYNMGLEPLPDIDFNIRAGNALVGFVDFADFKKRVKKKLDLSSSLTENIHQVAQEVDMAYTRFLDIQTVSDINSTDFKKAKEELNDKLNTLNEKLDNHLAQDYVEHWSEDNFTEWRQIHQPFHWFSEFYGIVENGGFDAIVGNPPYIRIGRINYNIVNNLNCPDIHGYVTAKSMELLSDSGSIGFIVMLNIGFGDGFNDLRNMLEKASQKAWFSFYDRRPAGLFSGARVRNCIALMEKGDNEGEFYTTRLHRWNSEARKDLFPCISYAPCRFNFGIPRFNSDTLSEFWQNTVTTLLGIHTAETGEPLYYRRTAYNFLGVSVVPPPCYDANNNPRPPTGGIKLIFPNPRIRDLALLYLAGRVYFSYWLTYGDSYDVMRRDIADVPFPASVLANDNDMLILNRVINEWNKCLADTLQFQLNANVRVGSYNTSKLWHITDESDLIFLKYMTDEPEKILDAITTHTTQTIKTREKDKMAKIAKKRKMRKMTRTPLI